MLIEQAFDKHFVMIPLRIDHPFIYFVFKIFHLKLKLTKLLFII
jgi:hypothetical protein